VRLTTFFEPPRVVPAVIRDIDLLKHRVMLESPASMEEKQYSRSILFDRMSNMIVGPKMSSFCVCGGWRPTFSSILNPVSSKSEMSNILSIMKHTGVICYLPPTRSKTRVDMSACNLSTLIGCA
jgi:hypothetical protein